MRIVGGTHRSRRLQAPPGDATRPTSDRVREALFSILGDVTVRDARVLDLFAGSGALGLEALSRGARSATFVDDAPKAIAAIRANLAALDLTDRAQTHRTDAIRFLRRTADRAAAASPDYDLVFVDPPYAQADAVARAIGPMLSSLAQFAGATIVTESDRRAPMHLSELPPPDERRYGDTLIRIHV